MKKDIEKYELIEKYLLGNLSDKEEELFESYLKNEPGFEEEIAKHKNLMQVVHTKALVDIKDALKDIHSGQSKSFTKKGKSPINGFLIGFLFIAIAAIFFLLNKNDQPDSINSIPDVPELISDSNVIVLDINSSIKPQIEESATLETTKVKSKKNKIQEDKSLSAPVLTQDTTTKVDIKTPPDDSPVNTVSSVAPIETSPIKESIKTPLANDESNETSNETSCENVKISADVNTVPSCDNKPTGEIQIKSNSVIGGTPPYQISINNQQSYSSGYQFNKQYPKQYTVFIRDINNCITNLGSFIVSSKECSYEYAFAPDKGEEWKIPTRGTTGAIKIFAKSGRMVYEQLFSSPDSYSWQGQSGTGEILPMGIYMFILELDNEENLVGHVTIIR